METETAPNPGRGQGLLGTHSWFQLSRGLHEQPGSCSCTSTLALPGARPQGCPALPSLGPSRRREIEWGTHVFVPIRAPALTLRERQEQKENKASTQICSEEAVVALAEVAFTEVAPACK